MKNAIIVGLVAALLALPSGAGARQNAPVAIWRLAPVDGSGIGGLVTLRQVGDETRITVVVTGLQRGTTYVSLYYDNATCALEPYSEDDVIGGEYVGVGGGRGHTQGVADDPIDEINSVSVRLASTFELLSCASRGGSQAEAAAPAAAPAGQAMAPAAAAVSIADFAFSPANLSVAVGTTVTWTNQDGAPHTVTADAGGFDSGVLDPGASVSFNFSTAGTFSYHCEIHPFMTGTVTVG